MSSKKVQFLLLVLFLFAFRLMFGLASEFWFEDEFQIYLIGLKSFTTHTWPYYGPDVVYTNTQIPGALQGLLVGAAFYVLPYPEAPAILLNILSFLSLSFFAFYACRRIKGLPQWLIWFWIMTLSWTMDYSTRVVNPSYVLVFAIPFFVSVFELLPVYSTRVFSEKGCFFIAGICPAFITQLHLSFVLLFPFIVLIFFYKFKGGSSLKNKLSCLAFFVAGATVGLATLVPTLLLNDEVKSAGSNVVFNPENFKNLVVILTRYLSFASYEIPYILGGHTAERLAVVKNNVWMAPFTVYLLVLGFLLLAVFAFVFFKNRAGGEWKKIKYLALLGYLIIFTSFFFSIKGPASHTFYVMLPIPVFYSLYCHEWLWARFRAWRKIMYLSVVSCVIFYSGLGIYNYQHKSLYINRQKVVNAINQRNYKLLGDRRADKWGYGY